MMKRSLLVFAMLSLMSVASFADEKITRTVLIKDGKVVAGPKHLKEIHGLLGGPRAYLGVTLTDLTPELRQHFGASAESGVLVGAVEKGSPADKAGIRVGDLITAIEGVAVGDAGDVRQALREKKEGDSARVDVLRNGTRSTLVASVVEREPRVMRLEGLEELGTMFDSPEWRGRIERLGDCDGLQARIKELENRLADLEKRMK
jgi:membrane-associated protease RseP (regulator of RpoE activity)